MRRFLVLGGLATLAFAAAITSSAGAQTAERFTVVDVPKRLTHHNTVTVGILTRPGTRNDVIGHDKIKFNPHTGHARGVFLLPNGKIKAVGFIDNGRLKVVGGTRGYNGVAGEVKIHKSRGNDTPLTFVLVG
jgi:hypothetical protein